jgi:hypothetical protein
MTAAGKYMFLASLATSDTATGLYTALPKDTAEGDATCHDISQMGDYLCVTATKTDGTYLYYTNNTGAYWKYIKISNAVVTPIGMAYANGLYMVCYVDASGNTKFWTSTSIPGCGAAGLTTSAISGYTPVAMASNGTNIGMAMKTSSATGVMKYTP